MKSIEEIKKYLKENLLEKRYNHTMGVVETSMELARIYGSDINKAEVAALCHDMAKNMHIDKMKEVIDSENIKLSIDEQNTLEIWHAIVGPILAKEIFNIQDEEILSAMRWHTTGKENMSLLDKIVYLADLIEPSRSFPGVDRLRELSKENLDLALIESLTHTCKFLLDKNNAIDINTIKARNYLIYNKSGI